MVQETLLSIGVYNTLTFSEVVGLPKGASSPCTFLHYEAAGVHDGA